MKGLSLIELMIAMTLGLATVAAVGWVYLGTMKTYRAHDASSRIQEGARHAFELIGKDLRMTGTVGCPYATQTNVITNYGTEWYADLFDQPLISIEQDATDVGEVNEFSDAVSILRADVSKEFIVQNHDSVAMTFTLPADHGIQDGELMVVTDCSHAAVFQATGPTSTTVGHSPGGTPGNSSGVLGATYTPGSRLYRLKAVTYYIAPNAAGVPSLFRLVPTGSSATPTPEELVEGVEDLQVTYGADTDSPKNGVVDLVGGVGYITATDVDSLAGVDVPEKWGRVVSVRVSLLMSTAEDRIVATSQTYAYNGGSAITAPDLRMRKVFTHVIKLRNR